MFLSRCCSLALTHYSHRIVIPLFFPASQKNLLTEPFGPQPLSKPCLCQNPAVFHWVLDADGEKTRREVKKESHPSVIVAPAHGQSFYLPYLAVLGWGLHAVIALWRPRVELALIRGTVHHSGQSQKCLHQQQHQQNEQQDVVGLLEYTQHTHRHTHIYLDEFEYAKQFLQFLYTLLWYFTFKRRQRRGRTVT